MPRQARHYRPSRPGVIFGHNKSMLRRVCRRLPSGDVHHPHFTICSTDVLDLCVDEHGTSMQTTQQRHGDDDTEGTEHGRPWHTCHLLSRANNSHEQHRN